MNLTQWVDAGTLDLSDTVVAQRLCEMAGESDSRVGLAVGLLVAALRNGSVCVDLASVRGRDAADVAVDLPWPEPQAWLAAVRASPLAGNPPVLRFLDELLYFDRYWLEEQQVCGDVAARLTAYPPPDAAAPDLTRLFPEGYAEQRAAAEVAVAQRLTVLTGGPGTGKTTTVARLLAALAEQADLAGGTGLRMALAAPTGKAAARLQEAVALEVARLSPVDQRRLAGVRSTTLHRLLGSRPDTSSRFRHHRHNRLPYDVVVIDETSMVSLTMMARLLEAVRPDARLVLVGDPDQLASVDAGAVLADLVEGLGEVGVVELKTPHRFGQSIGALAHAVRTGDDDAAMDVLRHGGDAVGWVDTTDAVDALRASLLERAVRMRRAAVLGDASEARSILEEHRLLCAHRRGPFGVAVWNRRVEGWLADDTGQPLWTPWYAGRPVLVTANDYGLGVYNGDAGVVVASTHGLRAHIGSADFAPSRLGQVETMFAMTIHKSQGSQADEVTVLLPPPESRLLTRELFYTAVTRAKKRVVVVGPESAVRAAIGQRAKRASGLAKRLQNRRPTDP